MDPNTLRGEIMRRVGEHEATGSAAYMEDKDLASAIGVPLVDVQRQIRILESNGLLDVAAAMGPTYGVRLTPRASWRSNSRAGQDRRRATPSVSKEPQPAGVVPSSDQSIEVAVAIT